MRNQFRRAKEWAKLMRSKGYALVFARGSFLGKDDEDFVSFREIKAFAFVPENPNAIRIRDGRFIKRVATFRYYKFKNALQAILPHNPRKAGRI